MHIQACGRHLVNTVLTHNFRICYIKTKRSVSFFIDGCALICMQGSRLSMVENGYAAMNSFNFPEAPGRPEIKQQQSFVYADRTRSNGVRRPSSGKSKRTFSGRPLAGHWQATGRQIAKRAILPTHTVTYGRRKEK